MENMDFVKWKDVTITGGFWKDVCEVNRNQTIPHIYRMFQENGYLDAYQLNWYPGKKVPHAFWDSEVAKWIEAVCYELGNRKDDALRRMLDETVGLCRMAQEEDGYLTIHFQSVEPELRWRNLRDSHEMYTAGHYIEAGVAYAQSGLGEELLKMAVQIAEHVWKRYGGQKQKPWKYGGHPELEYALMRLYHCTGDERWKEFAGELIAMRGDPPLYFPIEEKERKRDHLCSKLENGNGDGEENYFHNDYSFYQSRKPVKEMDQAVGHAVCLVYLMAGAAAYAREETRGGLQKACSRVAENLIHKRMYLTGGIGSSADNEGFTEDYDLPDSQAYAETCAAIGCVRFFRELFCLDRDDILLDASERIMYNAILSGVALDGRSFNYTNPLASDGTHHRQEWFSCACCPPNAARFISAAGGNVFAWKRGQAGADLIVCNYISCRLEEEKSGIYLEMHTDYPWDGKIRISVQDARDTCRLVLRIPGWCTGWELSISSCRGQKEKQRGEKTEKPVPVLLEKGMEITLTLQMEAEIVTAPEQVKECRGKGAIIRGPLVYCMEYLDTGILPEKIRLIPEAKWVPEKTRLAGREIVVLKGKVHDGKKQVPVKAIPYFCWDNRGRTPMAVWHYIYKKGELENAEKL